MKNEDYVKTLGVDEAASLRCLEAMTKYGDNHWWELDADPRALAYYQMHEPILLVENFSRFRAAVSLLLGEPHWTHELISDRFMQRIDTAWRAYQSTEK